MELSKIKELTDELMVYARGKFMSEGCFNPVIYSVDGDRLRQVAVISSEEGASEVRDLLKELSEVSEGIVLISVVRFKWFEKNSAIPESIENEKDACMAISAIVYGKKIKPIIRQIGFIKQENEYQFFDEGWKEAEIKGILNNPYKT